MTTIGLQRHLSAGRMVNTTVTNLRLTSILVIAAWLLASPVQAEAESLKWRTGWHLTKVESIQVGDVPGHVLGAGEGRGLAFFESGDVAIALAKFTFDYTNGSGPYLAYGLFTFEDGSTFVVKFEGIATADRERRISQFKGNFSFIQGSGRFADIQGRGSQTGKRFVPIGAGVEVYSDFTGTYTVPSR